MWVIPVFCENGSMEPKFTFAALGGLVNERITPEILRKLVEGLR